MRRYVTILISTLFVSCVATTEQEACLYECYKWNDICGYDKEESEEFCDQSCVDDNWSHPVTCEECFECLRYNQGGTYTHYDQQYQIDFCHTEPGVIHNSGQPCWNVCLDCNEI